MQDTQNTPGAGAVSPLTRWLVIIVGILAFDLVGIQMGLNGAFQAIFSTGSLRLTQDQVGIVIGGCYFGMVIGAPLAGRMSDSMGRRLPMFVCTLAAGLGAVALQFTHSFEALLTARVLGGIGIGGVLVLTFAFFVEALPASWCGPTALVAGAVGSLASVIAVFAVRTFIATDPDQGWRTMMVVLGLATVVTAFATLALPESKARRGAEPAQTAWADGAADGAAPGAGALLGEHRRAFLSFLAAYLALPLAISGFFLTVGLIMLNRHYDAQVSLQVTGISVVGTVLGLLASTLIANRVSRGRLIAGACAIGIAGLVLFAFVPAIPAAMAGAAAVMLGAGLANIALSLYATESFPAEIRGRATGILTGANRVMAMLTPVLLTFLIARGGEGVSLVVMGAGFLVVVVAILRLGRAAPPAQAAPAAPGRSPARSRAQSPPPLRGTLG